MASDVSIISIASAETRPGKGFGIALTSTPPWTQCGMINWKRRRKKRTNPLLMSPYTDSATSILSRCCGITPTNAVGQTLHRPPLTDYESLTCVTRTDVVIITETDRAAITTRSILHCPHAVDAYITGHRRPTMTAFLHSKTILNAKSMFTT